MRGAVVLGKWLLVVVGVLAFLLVVPLVEAGRALAGRATTRNGDGGPPAKRPVRAVPVHLRASWRPAAAKS